MSRRLILQVSKNSMAESQEGYDNAQQIHLSRSFVGRSLGGASLAAGTDDSEIRDFLARWNKAYTASMQRHLPRWRHPTTKWWTGSDTGSNPKGLNSINVSGP